MRALADASDSKDLLPKNLVAMDSDPSRLLRNGLAVVGFAAFEDFFVNRTVELLEAIDPVRLPFDKLPAKLQNAATWGAVQTLNFRARLDKDGQSRLALIQTHAAYLASTATSSYSLSPLSFAPQGSNLSGADIEGALKSLMIEGPWVQMSNLASRVGYGVLGLAEVFSSSAGNRHLAAHLATADMGLADIQELATRLRVVGLAVDVLMGRAICELPDAVSLGIQKLENLSDRVALRFLDQVGDRYKEYKEGAIKVRKWSSDYESALAVAVKVAQKPGETIVVRDHRNLPIAWYTP